MNKAKDIQSYFLKAWELMLNIHYLLKCKSCWILFFEKQVLAL